MNASVEPGSVMGCFIHLWILTNFRFSIPFVSVSKALMPLIANPFKMLARTMKAVKKTIGCRRELALL
jgi:hypothetical protein